MSRRTPAAVVFAPRLPGGKAPFGVTPGEPPPRAVDVVVKEFVRVLLELSAHQGASDVFRRWSCFWAYSIALDVAAMPVPVDGALKERQEAWCKELRERRDGNARWLESLHKDWRDLSCKLLLLLGEGLEARQGDFLSPVLERGLEGTNRWNGQFFTPPTVGEMMGRMLFSRVKPGWIETVCDPCCGCGSLPIAGALAYLEAGGCREDICVEAGDIDEGSVCACFLQCTALNIPARAQCMDALKMEPRGPMMVNPSYVIYETGRRLEMQKVVERMDEVLKAGRKEAPSAPAEAPAEREAARCRQPRRTRKRRTWRPWRSLRRACRRASGGRPRTGWTGRGFWNRDRESCSDEKGERDE